MKKLLSLILIAIMLVTAAPIAMAEGDTYKVGDIIQFGSYPQSEVTDSEFVTVLNSKAPAWEDWIDYGFYNGETETSLVQGDWMRYTDVTYNGDKYRGVKFTQYRAICSEDTAQYTNQPRNGYFINIAYWFKFEPIDWRILDPDTGLIMCESIIDSRAYRDTYYLDYDIVNPSFAYFQDSSHRKYASDYPSSSIREWLNNDFYNIAFTDSEKEEINVTTLNNDSFYTLKEEGTTDKFYLDGKPTKDKIFLLSYDEIRNSDYGFASSSVVYDEARMAQGSDYAKCQGLSVYRDRGNPEDNNSPWMLRTAGNASKYFCSVYCDGRSGGGTGNSVDNIDVGIRPVLRFARISGFEPFVPDESDDQEELCACICHESGVKGFLWKFFHFFYKLLHINDYCKCGIVHW